ncbi:MAG: ketoacyl-ACP synthase III [bacterium]|nr:ketoacyl-ACP synthase III [bacterium]
MSRATIQSIATHVPEAVLTNDELAGRFGNWTASEVFKKTGICERHIAAFGECASDLALAAAKKLIDSQRLNPCAVDALLFCTQAPDYILPTTACLLQDRLGLPKSILALDFNLGCSGYIVGLSLAKGLIESGQVRTVLLLTADTYSKFIHPMDRSVCTLFGDGASATVITATDDQSKGLQTFLFGTDGKGAKELIVPAGGCRTPRSSQTAIPMTDADGNIRTANNLYMNGREVFRFAITTVPKTVAQLMENDGLSKEMVDYLVLHQANRYMIEELIRKMQWPSTKVPMHIEGIGNTVSSSIPFMLEQMLTDGRLTPGKKILLVGFGVGYSWAGCSVVWS